MPEKTLHESVARILRVPPRPEPPRGRPDSVRVFNPAPGFYRYRVVGWLLRQAGTALGLVVGLTVLARVELGPLELAAGLVRVAEVVGVAAYLAQLVPSLLMVRLDYRYRWYMVTDSSLRIREGLLTVREQTMTFANIQNLSVRQGPLQRLFGISDLRVRTAGGGEAESGKDERGESANMHIGYFRGVDNAGEIRDLVISHIRRLRDSGLGDPDEAERAGEYAPADAVGSRNLVEAARSLRDEARLLRELVESGSRAR